MLEKYYFSQKGTTDLRLVNCGIEQCVPDFSWGPGIREHFIIHIVLSGKGVFKTKNNSYRLKKNDCFLISPGDLVEYHADEKDPWKYAWAGFDGIRARSILLKADIGSHSPRFVVPETLPLESCINRMLDCSKLVTGKDEMLLGLLYQLLSELLMLCGEKEYKTKNSLQEEYVKKSVDYIAGNYAEKISVTDLASFAGLDRSYLYTLFMKYLHKSPKDFITEFRIKKSVELLNSSFSIQEIARSVGYDDPLLFSKAFKKVMGYSPQKYRKINFRSNEILN